MVSERNPSINASNIEDFRVNESASVSSGSLDLIGPQNSLLKPLIVEKGDFLLGELICDKKKGFGKIFKAQLKGKQVACRVLEFERMKNYILDETLNELNQYV
jgi:hypothetical protein